MVRGLFSRIGFKTKFQPPVEDDNPPTYTATEASTNANQPNHCSSDEKATQSKRRLLRRLNALNKRRLD